MKGDDPAFIEATRLALKFFPEARSFLSLETGLGWNEFLGAMMMGDYETDHSCDRSRFSSRPAPHSEVLASKGGLDGTEEDIYLRLLEHTGFTPQGRTIVVLDAIRRADHSTEDCLPIVCDSISVPKRLMEVSCFGQCRDSIFIFEQGMAILVDHDDRVHWSRSRIRR